MYRYFQHGNLLNPVVKTESVLSYGNCVDITSRVDITDDMNHDTIESILNLKIEIPYDLEAERTKKLKALNDFINAAFEEFVSKYPKVEVESFTQKAQEAMIVEKDSNTALDSTPYLTALTGSLEARNALAQAVLEKVKNNAMLESYGVQIRDAIKSATTKEELEAVTWGVS